MNETSYDGSLVRLCYIPLIGGFIAPFLYLRLVANLIQRWTSAHLLQLLCNIYLMRAHYFHCKEEKILQQLTQFHIQWCESHKGVKCYYKMQLPQESLEIQSSMLFGVEWEMAKNGVGTENGS